MPEAATRTIIRNWKEAPNTLTWIKSRAQNDGNNYVRSAAVQELARGWKEDPETLAILKTRAQTDSYEAQRTAQQTLNAIV